MSEVEKELLEKAKEIRKEYGRLSNFFREEVCKVREKLGLDYKQK